MANRSLMEELLQQRRFAVTWVSRDPEKYGYKVYRALLESGYEVYPINPNADTIDGAPCYPSLDNIPAQVECLVTVTPPEITEATLHVAGRLRVPSLWMQPGSESNACFNLARSMGMQIVSGGACILVALALKRTQNAA